MGYILFLISLVINAILIWYLREVVKRFSLFEVESEKLLYSVDEYLVHINKVFEMSTFYGDSTIQGLLKHTSDLKEDLSILREIFILDSLGEEIEQTEDED